MAPLITLVGLFGLFIGLGHAGLAAFAGWLTPLRFALAGMFLLTASAHWGSKRTDLVRMVPSRFPRPDLLVTVTGLLELLGAAGLLLHATAPIATAGLTLLLLAMFPANVHAARERLRIGGRQVMRLVPRAIVQIVFLVATCAVLLGSLHRP